LLTGSVQGDVKGVEKRLKKFVLIRFLFEFKGSHHERNIKQVSAS
jgi:hypothetical protein